MPSTYTDNIGVEKIATGEQSGTWGATTNLNFDIIDQAINGYAQILLTSAGSSISPNTFNITDGGLADGRNKYVEFYSVTDLGGNVFVQLTPNDSQKVCHIRNGLTNNRSLVLFQGTYNASNDLVIPPGDYIVVFDGGGVGATVFNAHKDPVVETLTTTGSVSIGDDLTVTDDVTISGDLTLSSTLTVGGLAGGVVPSGAILMWSGSISSIPTGYVLCDGNNSTPNLRDRFVIGAGSTYNPNDTGGSATITEIPSHAHADGSYSVSSTTAGGGSHNHGSSTGSAGGHNHSASSGNAGSHSHSGSTNDQGNHNHSLRDGSGGSQTNSITSGGGNLSGQDSSTVFRTGSVQDRLMDQAGSHQHSFSTNSASNHSHSVSIGSVSNHAHSISTQANHNHSFSANVTGTSGTTGSASVSVLNPYYALAFIMKT